MIKNHSLAHPVFAYFNSNLKFGFLFLFLVVAYPIFAQYDYLYQTLGEEDLLGGITVLDHTQDANGFMWLATPNGIYRYDGYEIKRWGVDQNSENALVNNEVWALCSSSDGYIWVGTLAGLNRFDPRTEAFITYTSKVDAQRVDREGLGEGELQANHSRYWIPNERIWCITEAPNETIWVGTDNGFFTMNLDGTNVKPFTQETHIPYWRSTRAIVPGNNHDLWLNHGDSLLQFDLVTETYNIFDLSDYFLVDESADNNIRAIKQDHNGYIWLGTEKNGLIRFDPNQETFDTHFTHDAKDPFSLGVGRVNTIEEIDRQLWIGLGSGAVQVWNSQEQRFHSIGGQAINCQSALSGSPYDIFEDQRDNIWVGRYMGGTSVLYKGGKPFETYAVDAEKVGTVRSFFERNDGSILISGSKGLALFDPKTERLTPVPIQVEGEPVSEIYATLEDQEGSIWLTSSESGLLRNSKGRWELMNPKGFQFETIWLKSLALDADSNLLIGSQYGLFKYDYATDSINKVALVSSEVDIGNNTSTTSYIHHIILDKNKTLWVLTPGGLYKKDTTSNQFDYFPSEYALYNMEITPNGDVWMEAHHALAQFDKESQKIVLKNDGRNRNMEAPSVLVIDGGLWKISPEGLLFRDENGIQLRYGLRFGVKAATLFGDARLMASTGHLYHGGINEFIRIHPDKLFEDTTSIRVELISLMINGEEVGVRDSIGYPSNLATDISYTSDLVLRHEENNFGFEIAALVYKGAEHVRYRYRLEPYEKEWQSRDADNRFFQYMNIPPGTYTLRLRASNTLWATWCERTLSITIRSPWWATWWAYLLYVFAFAVVIFLVFKDQLRRRLLRAEADQLKQLDAAKTQLYTTISHEFRTPLTVILGLSDRLNTNISESSKKDVHMIRRNGKQLLGLVNQMLDLSKLDAGKIQVDYVQGDIIPFLRYLLEAFHSFSQMKQVNLAFRIDTPSIVMDYSENAIQKIVSNLVSNAIKYSPEGGDIIVQAEQKDIGKDSFFQLKVQDAGIGIPKDKLPQVFDRFYQVDNSSTRQYGGTGIGLAIVHGLVQALNGAISVQSTIEQGTTFTVTLPIMQKATAVPTGTSIPGPVILQAHHEKPIFPTSSTQKEYHQGTILIVEDNVDVAQYLANCLEDRYHLLFASDGAEGIDLAIEEVPDFIISDVMMPKKDGYEVCRTLKQDIRTCHIPIILLTARVDQQSKMAGLAVGAEAYLSKPFQKQELLIRIRQMIDLRLRLQQSYRAKEHLSGDFSIPDSEKTDKNLEFIQNVRAVIEEKMDDPGFSVSILAKSVFLSQAQLYRKIKASLDLSTNQYIRAIRLQRAKAKLSRTDLPISTIAIEVGYLDAEYFTKIFKQEVGMTPSDFRLQHSA